jgi:hypothetical protein
MTNLHRNNHHGPFSNASPSQNPIHSFTIKTNPSSSNHGSHLKFTAPPFNHPSTQYPHGTITARAQNQLQPIHLKASPKPEPVSNRRWPKKEKKEKRSSSSFIASPPASLLITHRRATCAALPRPASPVSAQLHNTAV